MSKLRDFVCWVIREKGYFVKFVPGEAEFDQYAIEELVNLLQDDNLTDLFHVPEVNNYKDLLEELSQSHIVITSRFHGVILSQLCFKPVIGLSYQAKFFYLMESTGQGDFCFKMEDFDVDIIKEKFSELEATYDDVTEQLRRKIGGISDRVG